MKPALVGEKSEPVIMAVALKCIQEVSAVRLKLPSDLKPLDQRIMVIKMIQVCINYVWFSYYMKNYCHTYSRITVKRKLSSPEKNTKI